jgi:ATP-dependent Clp protease ATP-binding subunit ClpX
VPFALADATPLTQAGYVGEDVESVIAKLLRAADGSVERAQHGIIYVDEIDKLAKRPGHDRDVSGEGVQQGLLKLLEGKKVQVRTGQERAGIGGDSVEIDTANILFIGGGAFDGLVQQVQKRLKDATGFRMGGRQDAQVKQNYESANNEDLARFGFLPEFLGRFPVRVTLDPLDEETMVRILTEPKDALVRQYQRLFQMEGARLECSADGLLAIARTALLRKTGARGLRAVMEDLLLDAMFELPTKRGRWLLDESSVAEGTLRRLNERTAA